MLDWEGWAQEAPSRRCRAPLQWKGSLGLLVVDTEIGERESRREGKEILELY